MRTWSARIRWLSKEEGGRWNPAGDGVRSQVRLGDLQTSCRVWMTEKSDSIFAPGRIYEVEIEPMFWYVVSHLYPTPQLRASLSSVKAWVDNHCQ